MAQACSCPCPMHLPPCARFPRFRAAVTAPRAVGWSGPCCHPCGGHPPAQGRSPHPCTVHGLFGGRSRGRDAPTADGMFGAHTGGATPRSWTPTTPPTNCWPKAPRGGGGSWRPRTRGVAPPGGAHCTRWPRRHPCCVVLRLCSPGCTLQPWALQDCVRVAAIRPAGLRAVRHHCSRKAMCPLRPLILPSCGLVWGVPVLCPPPAPRLPASGAPNLPRVHNIYHSLTSISFRASWPGRARLVRPTLNTQSRDASEGGWVGGSAGCRERSGARSEGVDETVQSGCCQLQSPLGWAVGGKAGSPCTRNHH